MLNLLPLFIGFLAFFCLTRATYADSTPAFARASQPLTLAHPRASQSSTGVFLAHVPPFFGDHARGWHWYEALPLKEETPDQDEGTGKEGERRSLPHPKTPTDLIKAYREELENRLHTAWVHPTPQNIKAYQEMQKDMMDRSKLFSTVWLQTVQQNPELIVISRQQQGRHLQNRSQQTAPLRSLKAYRKPMAVFLLSSDGPIATSPPH